MTKQYSPASQDVEQHLDRMTEKYHPHLHDTDLTTLFVFTDENGPCLEHQGYPAAAVTRVVSLRERAAGLGDAMIVIDRYVWSGLSAAQKDALIDHELTHLAPVVDDNGFPKADSLGRLKLAIRKHDWQIGVFDEVAERHGEDSLDVRAAQALLEGSGQLYFDFASRDQEAA